MSGGQKEKRGAWRIPPHIFVPSVIGVIMLSMMMGVFTLHLKYDLVQIRESRLLLLARYAEGMQLVLGEALQSGGGERVTLILRNLAPANSPMSAALVDAQRQVLDASLPDWAGRPLAELAPQARDAAISFVEPVGGVGEGGRSLHWFVPMELPGDGGYAASDGPGWLYLGADIRQAIDRQTRHVLDKLLLLGVMVVVGALLLGWWLSRRLGRPLRRLHEAVGALDGLSVSPAGTAWDRQFADIERRCLRLAQQRDQLRSTNRVSRRQQQLVLQCTRAMLQATSVQQAFEQVCRAMVDAGVAAAWVGRDIHHGRRLEVVARAGQCDHLPDSIGGEPGDPVDPLEAAVAQGEFRRIELQAAGSSPRAWQMQAARDGCVEAIAVPIACDQGVLGGLMLMCRDAGWSDDAAVGMLLGIGADLGCLVQRLDEAARLRASQADIDGEHALLRALLDSVPDLIFFKDRASVYLGCNQAFEQLVGRPERELVGGTDFDLFEAAQAQQFREDDAVTLAEGGPRRLASWMEYPDGRRVLAQTLKTVYRDADGHILGLVGVARDVTAQYVSEQALREERALFVAGPTIVFRWAPEPGWPVRYVSPNVQACFGYEAARLLDGTLPFAELLHPDDLQRARGEIDAYMADPDCGFFEQRYRLRHADGRYRWVYDRTTLSRNEAGEVVGLQGYLLDISDSIDNERRLRERVKEMRGLLGAMRVLAKDGVDVDATLQELIALIPPAFQFPDIMAARLLWHEKSYATPGFAETQWRLSEPVGRGDAIIGRIEVVYLRRPETVDESVFPEEEGDLLRAISLELARFSEKQAMIEQQRSAREALQLREQRFRAASESSRDLIYELDSLTSKRTWFGDVAAALGFDASHGARLASHWLAVVHPEDVAELETTLSGIRDSGEAYELSYRVHAADGSWRVWKDSGKRIAGSGGMRCVVGNCADITEIVNAAQERALIDQQLKIADRMETLGLLTRGITVELNSKLMPIIGFADIAQRRLGSAGQEKLTGYLEKIRTAANEAAGLLNEITEFGSTGARGGMAVKVSPMIGKAIAMLRSSIPAGTRIRQHVDPGLPDVVLAPADLVQVILNLCLNLQQANRDRGLLVISAALRELETTACSVCKMTFDGPWLEIGVANSEDPSRWNGAEQVDIDADVLDDSKIKGFGLAAIYRIVSAGGGHVLAEISAAEGYRFRVFLPPRFATRRPAEGLAAARLQHHRIGRERRVLVVDDDPAMGELLSRQLEQFGFDVASFDNTPQAFEYWRNHAAEIDLIVTDQNMPVNTGTEFTAMIREAGSDVPVLLCSGFAQDISAENIRGFGANAFLARPYSLVELDAALAGVLVAKKTGG